MTGKKLAALIALATSQVGVRESGGQNCGAMVEAYQRATGNAPGDSWCMSFIIWLLRAVLGGCPLLASGVCEAVRRFAKAQKWMTDKPAPGVIGLVVDRAADHAHHAFLCVTAPDAHGLFHTIEGNTNDRGDSNGDGVYQRTRTYIGAATTYDFILIP